MHNDILKKAITRAGGTSKVAAACGISYEAVRKWQINGLPRTEWTGETSYSKKISAMQDTYSADQLLVRKSAA